MIPQGKKQAVVAPVVDTSAVDADAQVREKLLKDDLINNHNICINSLMY